MKSITDNTVDVVDIGNGTYALISNDNISYISDIKDGTIEDIAAHEQALLSKQPPVEEKAAVQRTGTITFLPTLDCNLRCIYCYARGGEKKKALTRQMARQAVDNLVASNPDLVTGLINLHFLGGGEPFQNFTCVKYVCEYAKTIFDQVNISVVTNGTYGHQVRNFITENNVGVRLSYDGLSHKDQRPFASGRHSQGAVEENIAYLVNAGMPFKVKTIMTRKSVHHMADSVRHIAGLGVKEVHIKPVHFTGNARGGRDLVPNPYDFVENVVKTIRMVLDENLDVKLINSFDFRPSIDYYCRSCMGKSPTITPEGDISACVEVASADEKFSDVMFYGNTRSAKGYLLDQDRLKFLQRLHVRNYRDCRHCNIKKLCLGGCPIEAAWDTGDFFKPARYRCKINKALYPKILDMAYQEGRVADILSEYHTTSL